jgi:transglutaminase-like putative cysteine protease
MRLTIEHTTTLTYDGLISEAYSEIRLKPLDAGGQRCLSFKIATEPADNAILHYADDFGNDVRYFDWLQPHQKLVVASVCEVLTPPAFESEQRDLSPLEAYDYLHPTAYAPDDEAICRFAAPHTAQGDPLAAARALMRAVHTAIKYERGATDVKTTADDVLLLGRGVCQDFAHLLLSACRCQHIPARYVSGYLYGPRHADDAASHAWVDVFITGRGWLALDPTHDTAQTERYVRLGAGRDYADVPPTRGTYKGNAKESLKVQVLMKES